MADDMVGMAAELKQRAVGMLGRVKDDVRALEGVADKAGANVAGIDGANRTLKAQMRASWAQTCAMWALIAAVILVSFAMYWVMRIVPKRRAAPG